MPSPVILFSFHLQTKEEVGDVDILVNNAGIVTGKKFLSCPDHLIQKTMEVNTMAHFWVCITCSQGIKYTFKSRRSWTFLSFKYQ